MNSTINKYSFIDKFNCITDKCEDTCCKGWGMQVDKKTKELYENEAPELLEALSSGESAIIMKRDEKTDYCIKFNNGICKIHKEKGDKFLGDACYFFPRITRKFDDKIIMSASLSCPEITRLALLDDNPFELVESTEERIPAESKNYSTSQHDPKTELSLINSFIEFANDESKSPERIMASLISVAFSLKNINESRWCDAASMYLKISDTKLLPPEKNSADYFYLLQTLRALIHASKKTERPRLEKTFTMMEKAIGVEINRETLDIMQNIGEENFTTETENKWQQHKNKHINNILRKYIGAQLATSSFPFAGFGRDISEKIITMSVRFATFKLALMSACKLNNKTPSDKEIIEYAQPLSRFMEHLASPELSMILYKDAGWTNEPRLRALIGDE